MQALLECTELRKRGYELILLCRPDSRLQEEAREKGLMTFPVEDGLLKYPATLRRVSKLVRCNRIEIVHAQVSHDLTFLVPAVRLYSKSLPIVLTKRVGSFVTKKDLFHRWLYRHVSLVVAISSVIRNNVLETCPVHESRVVVLFDGVDLDRFSPNGLKRGVVRREFQLSDRAMVVGMVGRFSPGKGHEEFLQAAAIIHARFPEVRFLVVGEPSFGEKAYADLIYKMAEPLSQGGILIFTGYRKDIPEVFAAMDVLAFPSHAEAFGDVLIEAMAMELPVVSTNCDGVLDIVVDGETGIQVPAKDGKALAEGLIRFIQDEPRRRIFGSAGRKRVEKLFDLARRTDTMEQLYAHVLGDYSHDRRHAPRPVAEEPV